MYPAVIILNYCISKDTFCVIAVLISLNMIYSYIYVSFMFGNLKHVKFCWNVLKNINRFDVGQAELGKLAYNMLYT